MMKQDHMKTVKQTDGVIKIQVFKIIHEILYMYLVLFPVLILLRVFKLLFCMYLVF